VQQLLLAVGHVGGRAGERGEIRDRLVHGRARAQPLRNAERHRCVEPGSVIAPAQLLELRPNQSREQLLVAMAEARTGPRGGEVRPRDDQIAADGRGLERRLIPVRYGLLDVQHRPMLGEPGHHLVGPLERGVPPEVREGDEW
jgi:hypothetical protein